MTHSVQTDWCPNSLALTVLMTSLAEQASPEGLAVEEARILEAVVEMEAMEVLVVLLGQQVREKGAAVGWTHQHLPSRGC